MNSPPMAFTAKINYVMLVLPVLIHFATECAHYWNVCLTFFFCWVLFKNELVLE
jgi:hypothetical protein